MAPDPDRYFGILAGHLDNVEALLDQLVEYARIESGQNDRARRTVSIAELAHEAVEALSPVAHRRRVDVELDSDGPALVVASSTDMSRVLRNLLENAIGHSPAGDAVRVDIQTGPRIDVRVLDRGPGFPDDFRDHAFDPFTRADPARTTRSGHAGLGLAIARALVEPHGGRIWLGDGPGGDVQLWFPRRSTHDRAIVAAHDDSGSRLASLGAVAGLVGGAARGRPSACSSRSHRRGLADRRGGQRGDRPGAAVAEGVGDPMFGTNDKLALRIGIIVTLGIAAVIVGVVAARRSRRGDRNRRVRDRRYARRSPSPRESGGAAVPHCSARSSVPLVILAPPSPIAPIEIPGPSKVPLGWDRRRFLVITGVGGRRGSGRGRRCPASSRDESTRSARPSSRPSSSTGHRATSPRRRDAQSDHAVRHPERRLLPDRHGAVVPSIELSSMVVSTSTGMVDKPLTRHVRRTGGHASGRTCRHPVLRVATRSAASTSATQCGVVCCSPTCSTEAGVRPEAEQVFCTSLDGWTCGFPVAVAVDGRDAMIAIGMNGEPLPLEHGFPARLVVPGLYGYVSATKWLRKIELTTWDRQRATGCPAAGLATLRSRPSHASTCPATANTLPPGRRRSPGIAWAQHAASRRSRCASTTGRGRWLAWAPMSPTTPGGNGCWTGTQPGRHTIQVRATDKTGTTQTADVAPPDPDGATGYHTRSVKVA